MQNTTNDMTRGNSMKLIFQFFLPILIGNLFQQLYSFVDSMVVGKGIGDTALAAVGNTSSVHFLIIGFAVGLTGGLGICISHSFGANDTKKLRKEIAMSVYICLAIGIVITTFSLLLMRRLFIFLQTPEDMMTDTLVYFGTILAGSTITIFNNFVMTLLRSVGNSKVPLVSMVLSAIANIVLDLLFVFPLHMGVFGGAGDFRAVLLQAHPPCTGIASTEGGLESGWKNSCRADRKRSSGCSDEFCYCHRRNGASGLCQPDGNRLCGCVCGMHEGLRSV